MIVVRFGADALARVRFAISPLIESQLSVRVLDDPGAQALHLPWAAAARRQTADLDVEMLRALQPDDVYSPDFVNPPPTSPLAEIEDELSAMVATPAEQVRAEVRDSYSHRSLPPALEPFMEDPGGAVQALAQLVGEYWDRSLAAHWPRLRALLEGDVLYRARRMADGGAQQLFADIDPTVSWKDGVLRIVKRAEATVELDERGLLFVPSVFVWPAVVLITAAPWQPTLIYPARGVGTLWEPDQVRPPTALAALLGRSRAAVLLALDQPRSTTDLARALGITAGGASQQLAVLRDAGLVHGHRVGRVVLYLRTPAGDDLLAAATGGVSKISR
jgi:DNA-binding transcriptional ArsR family regulator